MNLACFFSSNYAHDFSLFCSVDDFILLMSTLHSVYSYGLQSTIGCTILYSTWIVISSMSHGNWISH